MGTLLERGVSNLEGVRILTNGRGLCLLYPVEKLHDENQDVFEGMQEPLEIMRNARDRTSELKNKVTHDLKSALLSVTERYIIKTVDDSYWDEAGIKGMLSLRKKKISITLRTCKTILDGAAYYYKPNISVFEYHSGLDDFRDAILKAKQKREPQPEPGDTVIEKITMKEEVEDIPDLSKPIGEQETTEENSH